MVVCNHVSKTVPLSIWGPPFSPYVKSIYSIQALSPLLPDPLLRSQPASRSWVARPGGQGGVNWHHRIFPRGRSNMNVKIVSLVV